MDNSKDRSGAASFGSFAIDTNELKLLLAHWAKETVRFEFGQYVFFAEVAGVRECQDYFYAIGRINGIWSELLTRGADKGAVSDLVRGAQNEYGETVDRESWQVFYNGTDEERRAYIERIYNINLDEFEKSVAEDIDNAEKALS